jgi:hypothetical protein
MAHCYLAECSTVQNSEVFEGNLHHNLKLLKIN